MKRNILIKFDGFMFIELLVVLVIIGVLASIAIPHYDSYKSKAREAQCESNRYHIELDEQAYYIEHGSPRLLIEDRYECPSGGTYVWLVSDPDDPEYPKVGCSIHYIGDSESTVIPEEPVEPEVTEPSPEEEQANEIALSAIQDLIDYVKGLNLKGIKKSMVSRLTDAQEALQQGHVDLAISSLNSFINYTEVQKGKKIPSNEADILVSGAQNIINGIS